MALTKKQKEVFDFIKLYHSKNGFSPTQKEIKDYFGLKSFGSVNRYMKYLQEAEMIEMDWNARRGIIIKDTPSVQERTQVQSNYEDIPLLGDVAAGNPIEAIENPDNYQSVPTGMISNPGKYYALNVCGDSMIEDGIFDGDILVCRHQENANQGQTVVAVVDDSATVKKFYKKKNAIELHPANERLSPFTITEDQNFRIAGVVVGLIRSYE